MPAAQRRNRTTFLAVVGLWIASPWLFGFTRRAFADKKAKSCDSDKLIFEYQRLKNSATFKGDQVLYDRDTWDLMDKAFSDLVAQCIKKEP